ncbi:hypothetical protein PR202_gb04787 [Eleusine coracana subsp. coracana]|uniref:dolichyl-diphosphooligosaccharide--protein glycotransferase n=1 Tax=Eleusine coracana subsp. coracana TaxID=191504 RepID=A0AAV5E5K8_ELECO|nr:hypothetical protein PR202_gb04787 [Eleusine coracana subsp. coracana]
MAEPQSPTAVRGGGLRNTIGGVLCAFALLLIGVLAFSIRLFSVIKYESVIHEFDPYFNYRVTQFLSKNVIYEFWNWFDDRTWYPLGRVIGGTVYPGLPLTAGTIWWFINSLNIPLSVETLCVFTAPIFSTNASWVTYLLTKELKGPGAGLMAATILAMVPSYISRSVAGSYDNEAVAIFALIFTFYLYVKTLNTGSLFYATLNALAYFYMVCSWGGYTFIINVIPMHVLLCIVTGCYSSRLYIAYAPLVVLGTLLAALVPVVGFNAVLTSEHFASFLVFIILHVVALIYYIKGLVTPRLFKVAMTFVITVGLCMLYLPKLRSTFMSRVHIINLHFKVRLMLVLAPAASILSGIALSEAFKFHCVSAAAERYSAPSIVVTSRSHEGFYTFDDFREAYAWLRHNTEVDDKVASWWDYGYQTAAMANRTVIVDNNTWNNTHIATVGIAMSSSEKAAWEIFNSLDVKYVLVVFGGFVGYPIGDDINKFPWMVRIGGGVFPHIKEADYLRDGNYRVDAHGTPTMLKCLMYKLSYYRFVETDGKGFDRVFTTHHWMVRIYKLKPQKNRVRGKLKPKLKSSSKTSSMRKVGGKKNPWQ